MSEGFESIRSYQRIFSPQRRLYTIEGRVLPVPGGVPLRWLGFATGTLLAVLALSARSLTVAILAGVTAAAAGLAAGGRSSALLAGAGALVAVPVLGFVVALLDWPLRLFIVPALVATLATQATPDGRRADRYALSWLALRLRARRRSLGRPLAPARPRPVGVPLWVAGDERSARLRRARVHGPARVRLHTPVAVRRCRRGRWSTRPAPPRWRPGRWSVVDSLELADGEIAVVRP